MIVHSERTGRKSIFFQQQQHHVLIFIVVVAILLPHGAPVQCFVVPQPLSAAKSAIITKQHTACLHTYPRHQHEHRHIIRATREETTIEEKDTENETEKNSSSNKSGSKDRDRRYWEIGATSYRPHPLPLTPELRHALETDTHPTERQETLGRGVFVTRDWRKAWYTYQSPPDKPSLIDPKTGAAEYYIDECDIEGTVPDDLVGVLYRNGPGKFGVDGERVQHVLDADGLILKVTFPPPPSPTDGKGEGSKKRKFHFCSRFVQTKAMMEEEEAKSFLYRGTFGTGPWGIGQPPKNGLNKDPGQQPLLSKILGNAFKTDIKNTANTQVISFGGKVLALFEAGVPHEIDPETLETIGEYDFGGVLPVGKLPVKLGGDNIPDDFIPSFLGGSAHTAHPNICSRSGNLVGWHWSQVVSDQSLEVTFTEWDGDFSPVASSTFTLPNCELAPHDFALTDNCIMLKVNSLKMNQLNFLSGITGPAGSLEMNGRENVFVHVFPRPTAKNQFEPYVVEVPPCFSIHFSHAYEDPETGNLVSFFSGWPPSDAKDFLGSWGGFAPDYAIISTTYYWRMEIDPRKKVCVGLDVAPGSKNVCAEHPLVHPNFTTTKAKYAYAVVSNLTGDSSPPCGYARLEVEDGDTPNLIDGEKNDNIDAFFFGTRSFAGEPLIVPKKGGDPNNEKAAYLLGLISDTVIDKTAIVVFDLERDLKEGPVTKLWLSSQVPVGLHGCFAPDDESKSSFFC